MTREPYVPGSGASDPLYAGDPPHGNQDMRGVRWDARADGNARVYQGMSVTHNEIKNYHPIPLLETTIPGKALVMAGGSLSILAFAGWASIIFRAFASQGETGYGPTLPTGIPLAAFYFVWCGGGAIIAAVGSSMTRAVNKRKRASVLGYSVMSIAVVLATVATVNHFRGSTPIQDLMPRFASCQPLDPSHRFTGIKPVTMAEWACAKR